MARTRMTPSTVQSDWEPTNRVEVTGRLSVDPEPRTLPSGDEVLTLRVVVPRADGRVDTLDASAWTAGVRRRAAAWRAGDVVRLEGALRRRFWRSAAGPASRWEIEVAHARRVVRAAA